MSEKIKEMAGRIREIREVSGMTADSVGQRLNIPADLYMQMKMPRRAFPYQHCTR